MPRPEGNENNLIESEYTNTQYKISNVCSNLDKFLCEKNRRYGDSALHPREIFLKQSDLKDGISLAEAALKARMNDKFSRIENSVNLRKNDLWDLMGYIVLLLISKDWENPEDLID